MTAHAVTETFPRPGLPAASRVELRKMADTRAGFWLLLIIALLAAAIVMITLIAGEAEDQNFHDMFQRRAVGRLDAAAGAWASSR